jgi:hypothetical protein
MTRTACLKNALVGVVNGDVRNQNQLIALRDVRSSEVDAQTVNIPINSDNANDNGNNNDTS